jgi:hypothetical protein
MNPFIVQNFSSSNGRQFHKRPAMTYLPPVQNGYFSSASRNNMPRYPYHTVDPYGVLPQNPKPLPANHLQYLLRPVASYSGPKPLHANQNSLYPINVLNGKVRGLTEAAHHTQLFIAKNEPIMKMQPTPTETKSLGKNFIKSRFRSGTNHTRLLDAFNQNFNLSRPAIHDLHDRKRKQIVSDEEVVVQNSCFHLNGNCNKRQKAACVPQNETNKCVSNPNAVKKNKDPVRYRIVIREDKNGLLKVCYEPLLDNSNIKKECVSMTRRGGSNNKATDIDDEPTDLDLTLHL